jgi:hypothetical protein
MSLIDIFAWIVLVVLSLRRGLAVFIALGMRRGIIAGDCQRPGAGERSLAVAPSDLSAAAFVVRIKLDDQDVARRLPAGSTGLAAIFTDHVTVTHVIRRVVLRQTAILNYVNPF